MADTTQMRAALNAFVAAFNTYFLTADQAATAAPPWVPPRIVAPTDVASTVVVGATSTISTMLSPLSMADGPTDITLVGVNFQPTYNLRLIDPAGGSTGYPLDEISIDGKTATARQVDLGAGSGPGTWTAQMVQMNTSPVFPQFTFPVLGVETGKPVIYTVNPATATGLTNMLLTGANFGAHTHIFFTFPVPLNGPMDYFPSGTARDGAHTGVSGIDFRPFQGVGLIAKFFVVNTASGAASDSFDYPLG
jgi:hypothetical protein